MNQPGERYDYACVFVLPVFNEATIVEQSVTLLMEGACHSFGPEERWKIVVIDNGSTDDTLAIAHRFAQDHKTITVLSCPRPGRGNAIKKALSTFQSSQMYCYLDIDIPIDTHDIARVMAPIVEGRADMVIPRRCGSRPLVRRLLSLCYRALFFSFFHLPYGDVQAGVKVFSRRIASLILEACNEEGYFLDTECVVIARNRGYAIQEVPIAWIEKRYANRKSKISPIRDSVLALRALARIWRRIHNV
ncbi:glycosyltransferase [Candidatus Uhrbacteria bacterium]|nr:glycosyltransferase [Candidatus Uhrbacteria bacterium]